MKDKLTVTFSRKKNKMKFVFLVFFSILSIESRRILVILLIHILWRIICVKKYVKFHY